MLIPYETGTRKLQKAFLKDFENNAGMKKLQNWSRKSKNLMEAKRGHVFVFRGKLEHFKEIEGADERAWSNLKRLDKKRNISALFQEEDSSQLGKPQLRKNIIFLKKSRIYIIFYHLFSLKEESTLKTSSVEISGPETKGHSEATSLSQPKNGSLTEKNRCLSSESISSTKVRSPLDLDSWHGNSKIVKPKASDLTRSSMSLERERQKDCTSGQEPPNKIFKCGEISVGVKRKRGCPKSKKADSVNQEHPPNILDKAFSPSKQVVDESLPSNASSEFVSTPRKRKPGRPKKSLEPEKTIIDLVPIEETSKAHSNSESSDHFSKYSNFSKDKSLPSNASSEFESTPRKRKPGRPKKSSEPEKTIIDLVPIEETPKALSNSESSDHFSKYSNFSTDKSLPLNASSEFVSTPRKRKPGRPKKSLDPENTIIDLVPIEETSNAFWKSESLNLLKSIVKKYSNLSKEEKAKLPKWKSGLKIEGRSGNIFVFKGILDNWKSIMNADNLKWNNHVKSDSRFKFHIYDYSKTMKRNITFLKKTSIFVVSYESRTSLPEPPSTPNPYACEVTKFDRTFWEKIETMGPELEQNLPSWNSSIKLSGKPGEVFLFKGCDVHLEQIFSCDNYLWKTKDLTRDQKIRRFRLKPTGRSKGDNIRKEVQFFVEKQFFVVFYKLKAYLLHPFGIEKSDSLSSRMITEIESALKLDGDKICSWTSGMRIKAALGHVYVVKGDLQDLDKVCNADNLMWLRVSKSNFGDKTMYTFSLQGDLHENTGNEENFKIKTITFLRNFMAFYILYV